MRAGFTTVVPKKKATENFEKREAKSSKKSNHTLATLSSKGMSDHKISADKERSQRLERRNKMKDPSSNADPEGGEEKLEVNNDLDQSLSVKKGIIEIFDTEVIEGDTDEDPLQAYKAVANPDVMYLHQAMKEKR